MMGIPKKSELLLFYIQKLDAMGDLQFAELVGDEWPGTVRDKTFVDGLNTVLGSATMVYIVSARKGVRELGITLKEQVYNALLLESAGKLDNWRNKFALFVDV